MVIFTASASLPALSIDTSIPARRAGVADRGAAAKEKY
jgi:hypothetical protein